MEPKKSRLGAERPQKFLPLDRGMMHLAAKFYM